MEYGKRGKGKSIESEDKGKKGARKVRNNVIYLGKIT
jgi:hypothetical protein